MEGPIPYIHGPTPRIMPFWLPLRPTGCGACWVCDPRYHQISSDLVRSRQIYRNPIDFRSRVSRFHVFGIATLRHVVQVEALVADGVLPFWTYSVYALATPLTVVHRRRVPGHGPNPVIQVVRPSNLGTPNPGFWVSGPPDLTPRGYLPTGPQSGYLGWLPAHSPFWTCTVYAPLVALCGIHRRDASWHPRYYGLGPIWTSQNGSF